MHIKIITISNVNSPTTITNLMLLIIQMIIEMPDQESRFVYPSFQILIFSKI